MGCVLGVLQERGGHLPTAMWLLEQVVVSSVLLTAYPLMALIDADHLLLPAFRVCSPNFILLNFLKFCLKKSLLIYNLQKAHTGYKTVQSVEQCVKPGSSAFPLRPWHRPSPQPPCQPRG